ncbi:MULTISPECIES: rubredoxin [Clostridium]|uniref:Rubredoxin n=1 Tax=Clostridium cibarium TaxID=2762247 RepID=A0ABR8PVL3_9CLOT|nr:MULTISPECIES: rubredoxin [Clostridium]MBD7912173.1 rubredoxin [Clostridium cibarium]
MNYGYYRKINNGKTLDEPKEKINHEERKAIYECTVCQYVYDEDIPFEELPKDYMCPMCKQPKSTFEKINI